MPGLRPGTYKVAETAPAGFLDGKDTQGTPGTGKVANDVFSNVVLAAGVSGQNNNFGEIVPRADLGVSLSMPGTATAGGPADFTPLRRSTTGRIPPRTQS